MITSQDQQAALAAQEQRFFPRVTTISPEEIAHANRASTQMLLAMGALRKPVYGGTVDPVTVRERRRRNKAARCARRVHRARRH